jgi:hypothetical protein
MNTSFIPHIGIAISIGGIIYKVGQQSEKLQIIGMKVEAQESKEIHDNDNICEIKNQMTILKTDISYIKNDIHEIKNEIKKK